MRLSSGSVLYRRRARAAANAAAHHASVTHAVRMPAHGEPPASDSAENPLHGLQSRAAAAVRMIEDELAVVI